MIWILKVRGGFSAAHRLIGSGGKCESLHGHNFKVELEVEGRQLDDTGMVVDFGVLKDALNSVISDLDHRDLNEVAAFKRKSPSSENIARHILEEVEGRIADPDVKVRSVIVSESDTASAMYFPEEN
jgi:6-pyruvoyltetrahydropterin/6-carboxytetrahydropterin synthase